MLKCVRSVNKHSLCLKGKKRNVTSSISALFVLITHTYLAVAPPLRLLLETRASPDKNCALIISGVSWTPEPSHLLTNRLVVRTLTQQSYWNCLQKDNGSMLMCCVLTVCLLVVPDHQEDQWEGEVERLEVYPCCSRYIYWGQTHTAFSPQEPDHTLPNQGNGHITAPSYLDEKTASGCLVSQHFPLPLWGNTELKQW